MPSFSEMYQIFSQLSGSPIFSSTPNILSSATLLLHRGTIKTGKHIGMLETFICIFCCFEIRFLYAANVANFWGEVYRQRHGVGEELDGHMGSEANLTQGSQTRGPTFHFMRPSH